MSEYIEMLYVDVKEHRTPSGGRVRLYKCSRCGNNIPRASWFKDCPFCEQKLNWERVRAMRK